MRYQAKVALRCVQRQRRMSALRMCLRLCFAHAVKWLSIVAPSYPVLSESSEADNDGDSDKYKDKRVDHLRFSAKRSSFASIFSSW